MEPSIIIGIIQTLGVSTAILLGLAWFGVYKAWPYYCQQQEKMQQAQFEQQEKLQKSQEEARNAVVKATQNNSEMTMNLVQTMFKFGETLNAISHSISGSEERQARQTQLMEALQQSQVQITSSLEVVSRSISEINDDMTLVREDISALYERTGTPRPVTRKPTPPKA